MSRGRELHGGSWPERRTFHRKVLYAISGWHHVEYVDLVHKNVPVLAYILQKKVPRKIREIFREKTAHATELHKQF